MLPTQYGQGHEARTEEDQGRGFVNGNGHRVLREGCLDFE